MGKEFKLRDRNLEKQLLHYIKYNPKLVFEQASAEYFSAEDYAEVFGVFASYFFSFGGIISSNTVHAHFSERKLMAIAHGILDCSVDDMDLSELEFLLSRLAELSIARTLQPMVLDAVDEMGQGHGGEALEIIERGLIDIQRKQRRTIREIDDIDGDVKSSLFLREENLASDKRDERAFNLGFPGFDEFSGGIKEGQLVNFIAPTGQGKSIVLMNIGGNMYDAGLNVIYVLLEMDRREWELRYDSWLTGIRFRKLYTRHLNKEEWRQYKYAQIISLLKPNENADFIKWFKREGSKLLYGKTIKEFMHKNMDNCSFRNNIFYPLDIPRGCTMEVLETRVNYIRQKHGCDVLLVDYPGIMSYKNRIEGDWKDLEQLFKQLKEFARFYRIPVICVAQARDEELGPNRRMSSGLVRFSKAILDHCDLALGWVNSLDDVRKRRMVMKPLKVRHISSNFEIELDANLDIMRVTEVEFREL